jgi:hypothetical protein
MGGANKPQYFLPDDDADSLLRKPDDADEAHKKTPTGFLRRYLCGCWLCTCACCGTGYADHVRLTTKPRGKKRKKRDSKADARGPEPPPVVIPPHVLTPDEAATRIQSLARKLVGQRLAFEQWQRAKAASDAYWAEVARIEAMALAARRTREAFIKQYVADVTDTAALFIVQTAAAVCIQRYFRGWNVRRKIVPPKKPRTYWLRRQGARPRFGKPTYRRVWARTEYEPEGGWPALDVFAKLDYDVNLWQYAEQVPRNDAVGLRTIKAPLGALNLKDDFILCSRNKAWVGVPVYLGPNKSKKAESVVTAMLTMKAPDADDKRRVGPRTPKSAGAAVAAAAAAAAAAVAAPHNEESFLLGPSSSMQSPPPSPGQGRMREIFERAEAEERALPHITPVQMRYAAFNSPYAQRLGSAGKKSARSRPGSAAKPSTPGSRGCGGDNGHPHSTSTGQSSHAVELQRYKMLKNIGWNPTDSWELPEDNGDAYFRGVHEDFLRQSSSLAAAGMGAETGGGEGAWSPGGSTLRTAADGDVPPLSADTWTVGTALTAFDGVDMSVLSRPTVRVTNAAAAFGADAKMAIYVNPVTHTPSRGAAKPQLLLSTSGKAPPAASSTTPLGSTVATHQQHHHHTVAFSPSADVPASVPTFSSTTDRGIKVDQSAYSLARDLDERGAGGISDSMYARYVSGPWGGFMRKLFRKPRDEAVEAADETGSTQVRRAKIKVTRFDDPSKAPTDADANALVAPRSGEVKAHGSDIIRSRNYMDRMKNKSSPGGGGVGSGGRPMVDLAVAKIKPRRHFRTQYTWLPQLLVKAAVNADRHDRASTLVHAAVYDTPPVEDSFFTQAVAAGTQHGPGRVQEEEKDLGAAASGTLSNEGLKSHFQQRYGVDPVLMEGNNPAAAATMASTSVSPTKRRAGDLVGGPMPTIHTLQRLREVHMGDDIPYRDAAEREHDQALRSDDFYFSRGHRSAAFQDSTLARHDVFRFERRTQWPVAVQKQFKAGEIDLHPAAPRTATIPAGLKKAGNTVTVVNHDGEWGPQVKVVPTVYRRTAVHVPSLGADRGIPETTDGQLLHPYHML